MSYKSLLFCPDERTARPISQILTELEFSVEPVNETFAAVKKLGEERFDALVVDCQNEQEASVLFKAARDSAQNHSSLSVAVVEGQAAVAKAFRIGANLVLSKPINIEQSKGTLRVARGLLRKNDAKVSAAPAQPLSNRTGESPAPLPAPVAAFSMTPAKPADAPPAIAATAKADAPFSALELEADPTPEPEAAEVAVLESLPELAGNRLAHASSAASHVKTEPIAGGATGAAAAAAPALEKPVTVQRKAESLPPMVTNEPIVSAVSIPERLDKTSDVPVFSSFETAAGRGSDAVKFFKFVAMLSVIAGAGYFGWTKLQPLQYLQRIRATQPATVASEPEPVSTPTAPPAQSTASPPPTQITPEPPASNQHDLEISASPSHSDGEDDEAGDVRVQELPMSRDAKPVPPKPAPLMVKPDTVAPKAKSTKAAPPPVQIAAVNGPGLPLSNLTGSSPALPTLAPSSLRVSQGVSQGLILRKVPPVYPPMALQLHKQGAVELLVTVTKQGTISNVKVVSGDALLVKAAVDAVRQWKYRPYLLNGEPVDIQTQITINFTAPR
jgi:protein TonB